MKIKWRLNGNILNLRCNASASLEFFVWHIFVFGRWSLGQALDLKPGTTHVKVEVARISTSCLIALSLSMDPDDLARVNKLSLSVPGRALRAANQPPELKDSDRNDHSALSLQAVTSLRIFGCAQYIELAPFAAVVPNLTDLAVSNCVTQFDLAGLINCWSSVAVLELSHCNLEDPALQQIALLKTVQHLSLAYNSNLTDRNLGRLLPELQCLVSLDLTSCSVGSHTVQEIARLSQGPCLDDLALQYMAVITQYPREAMAFREFAVKSQKLEKLPAWNNVSGIQAVWLSVQRDLNRAWDVQPSVFHALSQSTSLVYLNLSKFSPLSHKDIVALSDLPSLKVLVLEHCNLSNPRLLVELGETRDNMRLLDLRGNLSLRPCQVYDALAPVFSSKTAVLPAILNMRWIDPQNAMFVGSRGRASTAKDRNRKKLFRNAECFASIDDMEPFEDESQG